MHTQFDFVHVVKLTQCFNVKWAWVTTIGPGEPKNSVDLWSFIIMYNIYIYSLHKKHDVYVHIHIYINTHRIMTYHVTYCILYFAQCIYI